MCTQNAFRYWGRIAYDEKYGGVALSNDEGERMCRAMGDKDILFLRNHGVIVSGPTVAQAYDDLYYLERAAMVQVLAMQTGRPLHNIDEAMAEHTARQIAGEAQQAFLHFESLKRLLDRDEPGWQQADGLGGNNDGSQSLLIAAIGARAHGAGIGAELRQRRRRTQARRARDQGLAADSQDQDRRSAHLRHAGWGASCAAR